MKDMRIKSLDGYFDRDTKVSIEFVDADAFDDGRMERIIALYGNYYVRKISPIWDAGAQVAKLRIIAKTPAKVGRPRKKVCGNGCKRG